MRALEQAAQRADLLVKASGIGIFDDELEAAVPDTARPGTIVAYWDVDAPATLDGMSSNPVHPLRRGVPRYDVVFTYGGGEPVINAYQSFGARRCVPIYNALDPDTHYSVPAQQRHRCDLSLLANRLPDREARIEEFFFTPAALRPDKSFLLGGAGWETRSLPANVGLLGHVGTADHNSLFSSSVATLNVNRASMARYGFSPPTRIFEAAGCASCIISDAWQGIEMFLDPGAEILVASCGAEVADIVAALTPARANGIGRVARARVLADHTYARRALEVEHALAAENRSGEVAA
jgi:spore maturation protein CgeB